MEEYRVYASRVNDTDNISPEHIGNVFARNKRDAIFAAQHSTVSWNLEWNAIYSTGSIFVIPQKRWERDVRERWSDALK